MRFSIKWMMGATAYAAFFTASMNRSDPSWILALEIAFLSSVVFAAVGLLSRRSERRWRCIGFLAFAFFSFVIFFEDDSSSFATNLPVGGIGERIDNQMVDLLVRLNMWGEPTENREAERKYFDQMVGLSFSEIYSYTEKQRHHLRSQRLWVLCAKEILKYHLVLIFSLLGGLLGLWFWKREHRGETTV